MKKGTSRRAFLRGAGTALAAPWIIPASARGADGAVAPSERIGVVVIGRGAMGRGHVGRMVGDKAVQVLAVCDPDKTRAQEGKEAVEAHYARSMPDGSYKGCTACTDYRELLVRKDVDGVIIATPDHWHTPISVHAVKAGKDVYCEKPVSMSLRQGRDLVEAVDASKRVFQTGTQYRSMQVMREAIAFVRAGKLGKVKSVFTIWGWVGIPNAQRSRVPQKALMPEEPVPEWLDWDMWLGPAPLRPYNQAYHRNPIPGVVPWNFCEDFGLGCSTGYHSHAADVIQYALGVEESGPVEIINPEDGGAYPTLTCRYDNGVLLHHVDNWKQMKDLYKDVPSDAKIAGNFGGVFVGERGWLTVLHGGRLEASSEAFFEEMGLKNPVVTGANNHHDNWLQCMRSREKPSAHAELGHRAAALGQLVAASYKLERSLKWDPVKEIFAGDDEANKLREIAYRAPHQL